MSLISRRHFAAAATAAAARPGVAAKPASIEAALRRGIDRYKIPCVTAMVADSRRVMYQGAFGTRDAESHLPARIDSIFSIASMTKAITSLAAMQLVERGQVQLDAPAQMYLPELVGRQVLEGFEADGHARLRAPARPVTLHHLLTHTSGLCYALWDATMAKWQTSAGVTQTTPAPLLFDPGTRWQYGQGIDLAGRLVEKVSGLPLEEYFQKNIFAPLGMKDTSFILPPEKFDRLVTGYRLQPDGTWLPNPRRQPAPPQAFGGGGGLYSTSPDYVRFMQAILKKGGGLIKGEAFTRLTTNQIGKIRAGYMASTAPATSADVDIQPGQPNGHSLGFVVNPAPHQGGRGANSLAWAGINNTFYWIDPKRNRCAVIMMQFLPFVDAHAIGLLNEFERAVYAT